MMIAAPVSLYTSRVTLAGREMRVYHLDDGQRVVDADDLDQLVADLDAGRTEIAPEQFAQFWERVEGGSA